MRICHVAYAFYESDNRIMRYAETLATRGDQVEVIALRHPGQRRNEVLHGVQLSRLQIRIRNERHAWTYLIRILLFMVRASLSLTWKHICNPFQAVHVHSVPDFLVFCAWVPKLLGARVILDIHDILPEFYASKFKTGENSLLFRSLLLLERLSTGFADHVIIANHLWHERLSKRAVPASKCTPILNAPDTHVFRRENHRRDDDKFIVIYPGSLNRHQGLDIAIRVIAKACTIAPRIELHIYGEGPAKKQLIELAKACGAEQNVRFFPLLPLRQVAALMASADLGIVPKRADGFGNEAFSTKVLEFMCLGVPVILSGTKIDRYYFNQSVVTFFESGDEDELLSQTMRLFKCRDQRLEQAERAYAFVQNLTWNVYKTKYIDLLSSLATKKSAPVAKSNRDEGTGSVVQVNVLSSCQGVDPQQ
jgi:glycosyltransferase involved in cell wall biosynthesis